MMIKTMKTSTQKPVIPRGYNGRDFNAWQQHLQRELDKLKNTNISTKLR